MNFKNKKLTLAIAFLCLSALPAVAQSSKPSFAVPPMDRDAKPVVASFVNVEQDASSKCQMHLKRGKTSSEAEVIKNIQAYRACKSEHLLHGMSVWRWAS